MKKLFTTAFAYIILASLTLAACGPLHQFDSEIQQQVRTEVQASTIMAARSKDECGNDVTDNTIPERENVMEVYNCVENLVREELLPVTMAPDLLLTKMAAYRKATAEYADGKLSKDSLQAEYDIADAQYTKGFKQLYLQKRALAQQEQKEFSAKLDALGKSLRNSNTSNSFSGGSCSSLSLPPLAIAPCRYACVNGQWAKICN